MILGVIVFVLGFLFGLLFKITVTPTGGPDLQKENLKLRKENEILWSRIGR